MKETEIVLKDGEFADIIRILETNKQLKFLHLVELHPKDYEEYQICRDKKLNADMRRLLTRDYIFPTMFPKRFLRNDFDSCCERFANQVLEDSKNSTNSLVYQSIKPGLNAFFIRANPAAFFVNRQNDVARDAESAAEPPNKLLKLTAKNEPAALRSLS